MQKKNNWKNSWPQYDQGLGYHYQSCNHWRQTVRVGRYVVTCSSAPYSHDKAEPKPDFGIYLAKSSWESRLSEIWTNGCYLKSVAEKRSYPALVVDWPDFGVIKVELLAQLVNIALSKMRHGKCIDIACMAGHGRTGTLLACLIARVEHIPAWIACDEVHARYCRYAIENPSQGRLIEEYVAKYGVRTRRINERISKG
jgi:protein-tyrosine phosphatase